MRPTTQRLKNLLDEEWYNLGDEEAIRGFCNRHKFPLRVQALLARGVPRLSDPFVREGLLNEMDGWPEDVSTVSVGKLQNMRFRATFHDGSSTYMGSVWARSEEDARRRIFDSMEVESRRSSTITRSWSFPDTDLTTEEVDELEQAGEEVTNEIYWEESNSHETEYEDYDGSYDEDIEVKYEVTIEFI